MTKICNYKIILDVELLCNTSSSSPLPIPWILRQISQYTLHREIGIFNFLYQLIIIHKKDPRPPFFVDSI
jgi:hypothetical protein